MWSIPHPLLRWMRVIYYPTVPTANNTVHRRCKLSKRVLSTLLAIQQLRRSAGSKHSVFLETLSCRFAFKLWAYITHTLFNFTAVEDAEITRKFREIWCSIKNQKKKKKKRNMLKSLNFEDRIGNSFRSCEKFIDRIFHRFSIDTTIRLFNFGSFYINNIKIKEFLQNQRVRLPRIPRFHQIFLSKFIWKYISLNYPIKYFERRKVEKKKRKKRKTLITD